MEFVRETLLLAFMALVLIGTAGLVWLAVDMLRGEGKA